MKKIALMISTEGKEFLAVPYFETILREVFSTGALLGANFAIEIDLSNEIALDLIRTRTRLTNQHLHIC